MKRMSPEATALAQALLDHHRRVCLVAGVPIPSPDSCVIPYKELCERAGVEFLTRSVGIFMGEIAEWCAANGWPPLNSLAVNGETRMPGYGYENAVGCSILDWPVQIEMCIGFRGYPARAS
jgi:hypothetical protein